jgi:prepilin-type N-terminal cleavage/methylation domain-containing protein
MATLQQSRQGGVVLRPTLAERLAPVRNHHDPAPVHTGANARGLDVSAHRHRPTATVASKPTGYTLLELVTVLAIVAIGVTLALPSFREIGVRSNTTAITNDLVGALAQARAEAVKRGVFVAVVAASGGDDWSTGWGVYADSARDGTFVTPIIKREAVPVRYAVRAGGESAGRVVFSGQGELVGAQQFDINVCRPDRDAVQSRFIQVRLGGTVVARRDTSTSSAPSC